MSFDIALTGLNAAQNDLEIVSNNIANSETAGFKKSRGEFADIYASSEFGVSSNSIGQGVQLAKVKQQFTDGDLKFTDNALDLAVNGRGFFIIDNNGSRSYTRAGAFSVDVKGNIVNSSKDRLIGFLPDSQGNITGNLGPIKISRADLPPKVTSKINLGVNLDARQKIPAAFPTATSGKPSPSTYNHSTSLSVYDSLGGKHSATLYFRRNSDTEWQVYTFVGNTKVAGPDRLNFNSAGKLTGVNGKTGETTATSGSFVPGGVGTATTFTFDYARITQFGSPFGVASLSQDGFATGRLTKLDFSKDGTLFGRYSNGQSAPFGQVALANFSNVQGLNPAGNTQWTETFASGPALIGAPGSTDLGQVQSGALEKSNVDVTAELIDMIQTQRFFQANAQVIGAADEITKTIINIIR